MPLKASVIIPAYNAEKSIQECLKALNHQTVKPLEVIVVDDGSSDMTSDVSRKLGAKTIIQKNSGPAAARNRGANVAKGDILLFTDADCVPDRGWIKHMLEPFKDRSVSGVQGVYMTRQKSIVARFVQAEIEDRYRKMSQRPQKEGIDFIGTYSAGYRRKVFQEFGGFDESFPKASGEDPELSFRMANKGHRLVLNQYAVVSHIHPDSLGKYLRQKYWRAYWRVLLYKKHPDKMVKDSYTPQSLKLQIMLVYLAILSLASIPIIGPVPAAALVAVELLTALPFSIRASGGAAVKVSSPFIITMRSFVFGLGLFAGSAKAKSG